MLDLMRLCSKLRITSGVLMQTSEKAVLLVDAPLAPVWIADIMRAITMPRFLDLSAADQRVTIGLTAARMGWIASSVEKDC